MPSRLSVFMLCLVVLISVVGCQQQPPPPPPTPAAAPPPPEPSPEEQASRARSALDPILKDGPLPPGGESIASSFGGTKTQMSATENGRMALGILQKDVEDAIKRAKEQKRFHKIVTLCNLYEAFQPGSDRYTKTKQDAEKMASIPQVQVMGFVHTGGDLYAFIEVKGAADGKVETFKVREGEEFYKPAKVGNEPNSSEILRLVRIIGNQQECEIEYKPASFLKRVPGPRIRDKQ
jgi:hypothetical protein